MPSNHPIIQSSIHRLLLLLPLALSGCDWMGRQADAVGEYMPVIGDRCEHWQCITPEGQAESDAAKAQEQQQNPPPPVLAPTPLYPPDTAPTAPPQATAPLPPPSDVIYPQSPPAEAPVPMLTPIYPGASPEDAPPAAPGKVTPPL